MRLPPTLMLHVHKAQALYKWKVYACVCEYYMYQVINECLHGLAISITDIIYTVIWEINATVLLML